jgi:hypothetical protein
VGMNKGSIFNYTLFTALAVFFTFLIHEFAHWGMGELLGNQMTMTLNSANSVTNTYLKEWHTNVVSAAGPLITLLQAVLFYFLNAHNRMERWYPFLVTPFIMRSLAGMVNIVNPNDEGRIGLSLGIGLYTISILLSSSLFYLVHRISRQYNFSQKFNMITFVLIILFTSILIMANGYFKLTII